MSNLKVYLIEAHISSYKAVICAPNPEKAKELYKNGWGIAHGYSNDWEDLEILELSTVKEAGIFLDATHPETPWYLAGVHEQRENKKHA